jgi:hypothetical protein
MKPSDTQMKGEHGTCAVVRIKADNEQGFTEINEHDFDSSKHELFESLEKAPAPKKGKKAE